MSARALGRRALAAVLACLFLLWARGAAADALDEVRSGGKLLWGGDQEGGGPYVMPRPDDPSQVEGFEVDLAAKLAEYAGVRAEFFQGQWDKMPEYVKAQKIHVVLNGYEWTPIRVEAMDASIPYYVYGLQLLAKKGDASVQSWDDLQKPGPGGVRKVGVLVGSAAHDHVEKTFGGKVEVVTYEGNTDAMREVETGKIDATVQDTPIASYYASRFPQLRPVGEPQAKGYYVLYVGKGEQRLLTTLNEALVLLIRNGTLQRIYEKYGIWDGQQEELLRIAENGKFYGYAKAALATVEAGELPTEDAVQAGTRKRGWKVVEDYAGTLVKAAGMTVLLSIVSFPTAIFIGLLIAVGRLYGPIWIRKPLGMYVEFLRGTPLMLQLYFIFFVLPEIGVKINAFATAIIGLAVNYSAYESEIYRAGIQAIPRGQMEAALSLGMSRALAIRRIVVPQAVRMVIPPVMNDFIALFKDTSVCSVVTIVELTKQYSVLSHSTQATIELMIMTAILYLLMSYPLSILSRRVEKRLGSTVHVA
jgi:polar amino acid transport system substrate-binding protein